MRRLFYLLLLIGASSISAQIATIKNVANFYVKDSGAFLDDNNSVEGYFLFYETGKEENGTREYAVKVLDKNLQNDSVATFVTSKKSFLIGTAFNNKEIMFLFFNKKEKTLTLKSYDRNNNAKKDITLPLDFKQTRTIITGLRLGTLPPMLYPVKDKGFILKTSKVERNGTAYSLNFIDTKEHKITWIYDYIPTDNGHHLVTPVVLHSRYIVFIDIRTEKFTTKKTFTTFVLDSETGNKIFDIPFDRVNPKLITNSFVSDQQNMTFIGQFYKPDKDISEAKSLGFFTEQYNQKGGFKFIKRFLWKNQIEGFLPKDQVELLKNVGYIFFHDIFQTEEGDYYAIGEQYVNTDENKKAVKGIIRVASRGIQSRGYSKLKVKDVYIFKFDKDFNICDAKIFKKGHSNVQNIPDYGSPQLSAYLIKGMGEFDYVFSQQDKENGRIYASFIDYERSEEVDENIKRDIILKTIIHEGNTFSVHQTKLPQERLDFAILKAKSGFALLITYDKENKKATLRLKEIGLQNE